MKLGPVRNSLLVAALAIFFVWVFEYAKHDPTLRGTIPFGDDPYDAVSSFGAIAVVLLALVSLLRSSFPQWVGRSARAPYLERVQVAIPFCVLVVVAAEIVAMSRHASMWMGKPGSARLLILEASLVGFALVILALISGGKFNDRGPYGRAIAVWLVSSLALAIYPEQLIKTTSGHLFTVVFGSVLLFAPVSALVKMWVPDPSITQSNHSQEANAKRYIAPAVAIGIGLLVGALAYLAEVSEDTVHPAISQILFVGTVYVALGASGIFLGYVFLGRLLGFVAPDTCTLENRS
ncbi:MAG: hypothetical protein WB439_14375 [Acidobacteriaceae bacterium]